MQQNKQWLLELIVLKSSPLLKNRFQSISCLEQIPPHCVSLHVPCNLLFFKMLSTGQFITLFLHFKDKTQTVTNPGSWEKAAQPFVAFISVWVRLHNPPLIGVWAFLPQLLTRQAAFVSALWHLHTNTHRDACQEFAHTPAEMQINSWIDKKPARWNAKTIWVDMSRTCFSSLSLPALQ